MVTKNQYFVELQKILSRKGIRLASSIDADGKTTYELIHPEKKILKVKKDLCTPKKIENKYGITNYTEIGECMGRSFNKCKIIETYVDKKDTIRMDERCNELSQISGIVQVMLAKLATENSDLAKNLVHDLIQLKKQFDPHPSNGETTFGIIE